MVRPPTSGARVFAADDDVEAGAHEHFLDPDLYDFEYRRRRFDVRFYLRIAQERATAGGGPVLDLGCGSGRLLVPLLKADHTVVGLDHGLPMLFQAKKRMRHLSVDRRSRALLVRGDFREVPFRETFGLVFCAFHGLQHLVTDEDLAAFFRGAARSLVLGGWMAFDVLPPNPSWLNRDPERRWARSVFRHPATGQRFLYTNNHSYDPVRRTVHYRLYYQPVDEQKHPSGPEMVNRVCHRQLHPSEVQKFLADAGLELVVSFGGFDARPLAGAETEQDDEHIYIARRIR